MKSNKLIAEFMGLRINSYGDYNIDKEIMGFDMIVCSLTDTKFHTSWDWVMPVVAKISRDAKYWEDEYREYLLDVVPYGHIEDVYDAVVNFIKQII